MGLGLNARPRVVNSLSTLSAKYFYTGSRRWLTTTWYRSSPFFIFDPRCCHARCGWVCCHGHPIYLYAMLSPVLASTLQALRPSWRCGGTGATFAGIETAARKAWCSRQRFALKLETDGTYHFLQVCKYDLPAYVDY